MGARLIASAVECMRDVALRREGVGVSCLAVGVALLDIHAVGMVSMAFDHHGAARVEHMVDWAAEVQDEPAVVVPVVLEVERIV